MVYNKASCPVNNEVFIFYLGGVEALFILPLKQKFAYKGIGDKAMRL